MEKLKDGVKEYKTPFLRLHTTAIINSHQLYSPQLGPWEGTLWIINQGKGEWAHGALLCASELLAFIESETGESLSLVMHPLLSPQGSDYGYEQMALVNLSGSQNKINCHESWGRFVRKVNREVGGEGSACNVYNVKL